jgi:hypothetical protein
VLSFELKPGQVMVEIGLVERGNLKIPSKVFSMAFRAISPFYNGGGVVALFFVDQLLNLCVALKTVRGGLFFAQNMAFGAIIKTFQLGMGIGKISR